MAEPMNYGTADAHLPDYHKVVDDVIAQTGATAKTLDFIPMVEASDVARLAVAIHNLAVVVDSLLSEIKSKEK
jgi:hypothetical protein